MSIRKETILIVEDEPEIVKFLSTILSDRFNITISATAANFIKRLTADSTCEIDLAIIDNKLPDMSGIELLQKTKVIKPSLPVIVTAAFGDEDVVANAFRYGAREYVKKPFSYHEICRKVDFCLSLKHVEKNSSRKVLTCETEYQTLRFLTPLKKYYNGKIQKALKFIDENYTAEINLKKVSEQACLSRFHFSRIFKEATGSKYQEYVINLRINKAKKLLSDYRLTITDIAFAVGYNDLTNFERTFKKILFCTPSEYREGNKINKD